VGLPVVANGKVHYRNVQTDPLVGRICQIRLPRLSAVHRRRMVLQDLQDVSLAEQFGPDNGGGGRPVCRFGKVAGIRLDPLWSPFLIHGLSGGSKRVGPIRLDPPKSP
jgi:hypothetical protein